MEPGPLPPHERTWRHPSELGPTKADLESGPSSRLAALAVGTLAVIAVAGLVVAMTPRTSSSPTASAQRPHRSRRCANRPPRPAVAPPPQPPRHAWQPQPAFAHRGFRSALLLTSFSAFPHAITSGPQLTLDGTDVATRLPDDHDIVLVHTDAVTYELPWGEVPFLGMPDGRWSSTARGAPRRTCRRWRARHPRRTMIRRRTTDGDDESRRATPPRPPHRAPVPGGVSVTPWSTTAPRCSRRRSVRS